MIITVSQTITVRDVTIEMTETIETAEMKTVMVPVRITAGIMAITTAAETTEMTETAAPITTDKIHAETTAATETVMEITTTACLSVLRRRRADLTELNRSRKTPVRETVRKMIEIINQVVTARVRRKK